MLILSPFASGPLRGQVLYSTAVQSFVAIRYLRMRSGQEGCLGHPAWQDLDQVGKMAVEW